jgi:hypothetical protein
MGAQERSSRRVPCRRTRCKMPEANVSDEKTTSLQKRLICILCEFEGGFLLALIGCRLNLNWALFFSFRILKELCENVI